MVFLLWLLKIWPKCLLTKDVMNFLHSMGMKQKEQKKNLSFEICSVGNIALGTGICLALLYVMTYSHWYEAMGEKISTAFWSYWLKLVGIYIIIQIVVQKLFVRYVNKRI